MSRLRIIFLTMPNNQEIQTPILGNSYEIALSGEGSQARVVTATS
jgi:hypothetical protein